MSIIEVCDTQIHENDEGSEFLLTFTDAQTGNAIDLTPYQDEPGSDVLQVRFQPPTGAAVDKTLTVHDAVDGQAKYISEAGFLTPAGTWKLQGHLRDDAAGKEYRTAVMQFIVHSNL